MTYLHLTETGHAAVAGAFADAIAALPARGMQCKDIKDRPVLEFIRRVENREIEHVYEQSGKMESFFPSRACVSVGVSYSVAQAMPGVTSEKLVRAKMGQLMRRGLVDGCTCGCRGDFTLTEKGREMLAPIAV